jgi:hypothetical protein
LKIGEDSFLIARLDFIDDNSGHLRMKSSSGRLDDKNNRAYKQGRAAKK